jgi:hypothetical protein
MIRYLRLPFEYDAQLLQQEAAKVSGTWKEHFNTRDYEGDWSGIALRSPGGSVDSLYAETFDGEVQFADTPLMAECPYIASIVGELQCDISSVRLLKLSMGAIIKEHTDIGLSYESGEARLHIPIVTHPKVEFVLDGHRIHMEEGSCWYINAGLPHRLSNPSPVHRIHLVIDAVVNDWLRNWFERTDLPEKSIKDTTAKDAALQQQVITSLRASGDPDRMRLADEMERAAL